MNLFKIRVTQKAQEVKQLQLKNEIIKNELVEMKRQEKNRERLDLIKEVAKVNAVNKWQES